MALRGLSRSRYDGTLEGKLMLILYEMSTCCNIPVCKSSLHLIVCTFSMSPAEPRWFVDVLHPLLAKRRLSQSIEGEAVVTTMSSLVLFHPSI